ncbi:MAG: glycosyltransferase family 39 protein [Pedobacter sp.]|nr:glycosyltransferase family 39 protein [Pedobacter sp.]
MLDQVRNSKSILPIFLAIWALVNFIQAFFMDLHPDEAYYWLYSKFLAWGYFDHPPMVALFIKIGDSLTHTPFGLRMVTVITTTTAFYLLWKVVSVYTQNIKLFILLAGSIVLFHVYGFITTPDSPLFFFTALFFYFYQRYLKKDSYLTASILAFVIACLLYSKYHAVLILFFTILSNFKLFKRGSFWLIILFAFTAFIPHLWWQIQNNYPSFYYHILDRSAEAYRAEFTYQYVVGQLLLAGPLVGWFLYSSASRYKSGDDFIKALQFNFYGIFIFFFFSTFKGRVEAHWTLPAMICLMLLAYLQLSKKGVPVWFIKAAVINIALIMMLRIVLIIPIPLLMKNNLIKSYFGTEEWALEIHKFAGESPVLFENSFQLASKYNYYTNSTKGFSYDSRNYRKNQYDIWPLDNEFRNGRAYYLLPQPDLSKKMDTISTNKGVVFGTWIDQVRMYQRVNIIPLDISEKLKAGITLRLRLQIANPYPDTITLGNRNQFWKCFLEYGYKVDNKFIDPLVAIEANLEDAVIAPGQSIVIPAIIKTPNRAGKYKLEFSIRTEPFAGSRNSGRIAVDVTK